MRTETDLQTGEVTEYADIPDARSPEEIAAQEAFAAKEQIAANKLIGIEFSGIMCSATSADMWGLASVKLWVEAGNDVNFEFDNGNILVLTQANVAAFEAVWNPFRASFFL